MNLSSKRQGNQFEQLFIRAAIRQDVAILRIYDGCIRAGLKKLIPTKQPCDFILANNGKTALIDTKTQASGSTFGHAKLDTNQIKSMHRLYEKGTLGGYVIWNRAINKVIFANVKDLFECLHSGESFKLENGLEMGTIEEINFKALFEQTTR